MNKDKLQITQKKDKRIIKLAKKLKENLAKRKKSKKI
jgi:hypothetical protein|tara:strand:+ start:1115 stop:1225 length:111 start_codon:yes stop_codon:yes gene_type:complete